jgi:hypothetical protein
MTKRPSHKDQLSKIGEAIDESILEASEKDLREDFAEQGDDFDKAVARVGSTIERAKASAAKMRFERAKREAKAFREGSNVRAYNAANLPRLDAPLRTGFPLSAPRLRVAYFKKNGPVWASC